MYFNDILVFIFKIIWVANVFNCWIQCKTLYGEILHEGYL